MLEFQPPIKPAQRTLCFFWLVDCSGSMKGTKIETLNQVILNIGPDLKNVLANQTDTQMKLGCIQFSDEAQWTIGPNLVGLEHFKWSNLNASGRTATAKAINLLCDALDVELMPRRGLPPVCILISDGCHTDSKEQYEAAISRLNSLPWGKKAVRLVIGIGKDGEYDEAALLKFSNAVTETGPVGVLKAHNSPELVQFIKWASTIATAASSSGMSQLGTDAQTNVVLPGNTPVPITNIKDATEVF